MKRYKVFVALSFFAVFFATSFGMPAHAAQPDHGSLSGYAAPTGLEATDFGSDVLLVWDAYPASNFPANCTHGREIRIYRKASGGDAYDQISSVTAGSIEYFDEALANDVYTYKLQARCNAPPINNNLSEFSDIAIAEVIWAAACAGAPTVEVSASPSSLWPPNGKMAEITVSGSIILQDNCTLPGTSYSIVDEYGELSTNDPIEIGLTSGTFNFQVYLEASRRGDDLDGRLYTIKIETQDGGVATVPVIVPHDQRKK